MKKNVLMLLLAAMSTSVMADWVKYDESDSIVLFIDPSTIKKNGNFRKAWVIHELKRPDQEMKSRRILREYDCKNERMRILSLSTHTGSMASGETLISGSSAGEWKYIPPDTRAFEALQIVCSK